MHGRMLHISSARLNLLNDMLRYHICDARVLITLTLHRVRKDPTSM